LQTSSKKNILCRKQTYNKVAVKEKNDLRVDPSSIKQSFVPLNLTVHCCRYWKLSEWEYSNLSFSFWRLYYNGTEGATVYFKGKKYGLNKDKVLLIPPFTSFSTSLKNNGNDGLRGSRIESVEELGNLQRYGMVDHFFVHFNLGIHLDQIEPNIFIFDIDQELRLLLESAKQSIIHQYEHINHEQSLKIYLLVLILLSRINAAFWNERITDKRVIKVIGYIDKHYSEALTNEALSGLVNMATNSFLRLFKQSMGISIQRFVQQIRIEKAILEMHHAPASIEWVASKCGFNDRHHFSKVFKRVTGLPPAQYRQQKIYY
jgi:AraC-like DNA-binding protein